jgi:cold shock CspA family protein/ribosome-associated translation inhibitor RaiA
METPLEISFHNMQTSDAVEADIRRYVDKLEKIHDRIIGCRVAVEKQHRQHRTGNVFDVKIELRLPGGDVVVSREPHRAHEKYAQPSVQTSVRDAFAAAERQLKEFKEQQRGEVQVHEVPFQGQVSQLYPDAEHGFILTNEGTQLYFHRNSLMNVEFDDLRRGDPVQYVAADGDTGPTAKKVWVAKGAALGPSA